MVVNNTRNGFNRNRAFLVAVEGLCVAYVLVSFGFTGIPGLSRLSLVSGIGILGLLVPVAKHLKYDAWLLPVCGFFVYAVFQSIGVADQKEANDTIQRLMTIATGSVALGIAFQNGYVTYRSLVRAAVLASCLNVAAYAVGFDSLVAYSDFSSTDRATGLVGNANSLALLLIFTSILVWLKAEQFSIVARILTVPFLLLAVQATGSRKGLILAPLVGMFILMRSMPRGTVQKGRNRVILIAAVIIYVGFLMLAIRESFSSETGAVQRMQQGLVQGETSMDDRVSYIGIGLRLFSESPIIGHGIGQFGRLSGSGHYSHNNYVELLVSGGILGICIFYSLHLLIFHNISRTRGQWPYLFVLGCLLISDIGCVTLDSKMFQIVLVMLYIVTKEAERNTPAGASRAKNIFHNLG